MNRTFPFGLCLLIVFALATLAGCSRGTSTDTAGKPSSPIPAAISSSAQVVKVSSPPLSIPANGSADAVATLAISPGFHINANPATFSYLIATEVSPGKVEGVTVGAPGYPAAEKKKFQFAEQPLAVYEGEVPIKLGLRAEKNAAAGSRSLPITVRVQACDEEKCFPPATLNSTISVTVK
jgi:predicted component of type VI protein secretion system